MAPLGLLAETAETLNASRGGVLIQRREPCRAGAMLWLTFPFDAASAAPQPETFARVVRVEGAPGGVYRVALEFETSGAPTLPGYHGPERRRAARVAIALPIQVRAATLPWPEEAMLRDMSESGVRFLSARVYNVGDAVLMMSPPEIAIIRWSSREVSGRVVRVMRRPESVEQEIGVSFVAPQKR